jgi:uncharacterized protein YcfJ
MKSSVFFTFLLVSGLSSAGSFTDQADIISVNKIYKDQVIREPYDECYIEETYQGDGDGSATNEIVGGIFGGIIGNQFGDGDGKDIMTLAGTILGASLAHDEEVANSETGNIISKEVCERKYRTVTERRLSHYRVEYFYQGRTFTYNTKSRPSSNTITVKVKVTP